MAVHRLAADFYFPSAEQLNVPEKLQDVTTALPQFWSTAIVIATVVFMILLLVGGVTYLTSAGNEDGTKKATKLIIDAVVGLVLVLLAWPAGLFVLSLLGQGQGFTGADTVNDVTTSTNTGNSTTAPNQADQSTNAQEQGVNATVHVERDDGTPAANETIHATPDSAPAAQSRAPLIPTAHAAPLPQRRTARTDASGNATFTKITRGDWTITDSTDAKLGKIHISPEQTPELYDSDGRNAAKTWTFRKGEKLRQVVISVLPNSGTTETLKNFPLRLWRDSGSFGNTYYNTHYTDATTGKVTVELPEGATIILKDSTDVAELARYTVQQRDGLSWTVFVTAAKMVGHHFYFVDRNDKGVAGIPVKIRETTSNKTLIATTTSSDGRVTVSVPPGTSLYAVANGQQVCAVKVVQASEATRCQTDGVPVEEPILDSTEYRPSGDAS